MNYDETNLVDDPGSSTEQVLVPIDFNQPSTSTGVKDQPRNKKRWPDLKTLLTNKRKKLVTSDSSSEEEDDRFSLQYPEDSETFSEFENQTNLPIPDVQASDFLKYLQVGDFVLVRYEGELYPGKSIDFKEKRTF